MNTVLVIHSTEGSTLEGAVATLNKNRSWSHDVVCPRTKRTQNLVPWGQPARSLNNLPGGVETNNRPGVIQVEVVGFASRYSAARAYQCEEDQVPSSALIVPEMTEDELAYLADYICSTGVSRVFPFAFVSYPDSYGLHNGIRMPFDVWVTIEGCVGHQHVPENDHGDPGQLNTERLGQLLNPEEIVGSPVGNIDSVAYDNGKIRVQGWAYDPDSPAESIQLHIYVQDVGNVGIVADQPRADVNAAFGIEGNHGFDVRVNPVVQNTVRIFAIDAQDTSQNTLLAANTVSVPLS